MRSTSVVQHGRRNSSGTPQSRCITSGPDAPLDLERGLCASHMEHAYDFYKPCGFYPLVGSLAEGLAVFSPACGCWPASITAIAPSDLLTRDSVLEKVLMQTGLLC